MTAFEQLQRRIEQRLWEKQGVNPFAEREFTASGKPSAVLLILGPDVRRNASGEPCLILNKRSGKVKQGGDLCCPGGGLSPIDPWLARLVSLPVFPFNQWTPRINPGVRQFKAAPAIFTMLATGLREAFEEMRLNPLRTRFLGPIPPQPLSTFERIIHPLAVSVSTQTHFHPNWEVEKIVYIPLQDWLNPNHYANYQLTFPAAAHFQFLKINNSYPCFQLPDRSELVWGVTYRIITTFLKIVFDFTPPEPQYLPVIQGRLTLSYITGTNAG